MRGPRGAKRSAGAASAAATLIVALSTTAHAQETFLVREVLPASPPRRDPAPPPITPLRSEADPAKAPDDERAPFDLGIRVFEALDVAALPRPALGLGAGGAIERGAWRGEIVAAYFLDQTHLVGDHGAGVELSLLLAGGRFCAVPIHQRVELAACLGGETGVLRAVGFGVAAPGSGTATWLAPQAAVVGHFHLSAIVSTVVSVELVVPVAKDRMVLAGIGDVHVAPDLTGRFALGFELGP